MPDELTLRRLLSHWYRQQAFVRVSAKVVRFANMLGVSPGTIKVRHLRSGWSTISAHGNLQFDWKIIMAPHSVINYVVVHTLCQLKYPQQGLDFWLALGSIITDAHACQHWLETSTVANVATRLSEA